MTQRFIRRERLRSVHTPPSCSFGICHSTGLYRWDIFGHSVGVVCGKHRGELERAWERARDEHIMEAA